MAVAEAAPTRRSEPATLRPAGRPPVVYWAALGAIFVALGVYIFAAWVLSGEATPSPKGTDPIPTATHVWLWMFQILSALGALVTIVYAVRTSIRERRLSFDAMLLLGWLSVCWQDPIVNYVRTTSFYSAGLINLGSWSERIPGWMSPNGRLFPEPVMFSFGLYFWMTFATILCCAAMRKAKARWPNLGTGGVILAGFVAMASLDFVLEVIFIHSGVYGYPGVVHGLTIWAGHTYQFPIYESVLWGGMWTITGALRYFRDDKGHAVVERGVDEVRATPRRRTLLRVLAVCAWFNLGFLSYNVAWTGFALHMDQTPPFPSYLRAGICGPGTAYDCPGPTKPILLPKSPPDHVRQ